MSVESRLKRIEKQLGISGDDEFVEFPLPDGRIVWMAQRKLDAFLDWLQDRANDGQETIETS